MFPRPKASPTRCIHTLSTRCIHTLGQELSHATPQVQPAHQRQPTCLTLDIGPTSDTSPPAAIAAPEFNLRHKIARIPDLHERLCCMPPSLPPHEAVRVTRR